MIILYERQLWIIQNVSDHDSPHLSFNIIEPHIAIIIIGWDIGMVPCCLLKNLIHSCPLENPVCTTILAIAGEWGEKERICVFPKDINANNYGWNLNCVLLIPFSMLESITPHHKSTVFCYLSNAFVFPVKYLPKPHHIL